ncbi:MAG: hypothetical protein RLZZ414_354 [Bacteroidota bacterium]|jgi:acyl-CoA hydrolase
MDLNEKIKAAESRVFKAVFPNDTNHYDTMFGGKVMSMMDEIAFIAATRFCRKKVVTVNSDSIDFKLPIPAGTIIEFIANIVKVGNTSMEVEVVGYVEEMYNETRLKAVTGKFTFVAVNENKKAVKIID